MPNEADAANLHEVALELVAPADQQVIAAPEADHQVVSHQAVPALDEIEHALRFSDAAGPGEQQPHAENVSE